METAVKTLFVMVIIECACSRPEDKTWRVEERRPPLGEGLVVYQPEQEPILLATGAIAGEEVRYKMRLNFEVHTRAKGMPSTLTVVSDEFDITEFTSEVTPSSSQIALTVNSADVTMDPPLEGYERADSFTGLSLKLRVESKQVTADTGSLSDEEREVFEARRRLMPVLPDDPISVSERWPFLSEFYRPLPGGGKQRTSLQGHYSFRGLSEWQGREVAVIDLDYRVFVSGDSLHEGTHGVISGAGIGRGLFLVELQTGRIVRSQVLETTRTKIELGRASAEQLSHLNFELEGA